MIEAIGLALGLAVAFWASGWGCGLALIAWFVVVYPALLFLADPDVSWKTPHRGHWNDSADGKQRSQYRHHRQ